MPTKEGGKRSTKECTQKPLTLLLFCSRCQQNGMVRGIQRNAVSHAYMFFLSGLTPGGLENWPAPKFQTFQKARIFSENVQKFSENHFFKFCPKPWVEWGLCVDWGFRLPFGWISHAFLARLRSSACAMCWNLRNPCQDAAV